MYQGSHSLAFWFKWNCKNETFSGQKWRFNLIVIKIENTVERFQKILGSGYFTKTPYINFLHLVIFCYIIRREKIAWTTNVEMPSFWWSFNCADSRLMINICARLENFGFLSWDSLSANKLSLTSIFCFFELRSLAVLSVRFLKAALRYG